MAIESLDVPFIDDFYFQWIFSIKPEKKIHVSMGFYENEGSPSHHGFQY